MQKRLTNIEESVVAWRQGKSQILRCAAPSLRCHGGMTTTCLNFSRHGYVKLGASRVSSLHAPSPLNPPQPLCHPRARVLSRDAHTTRGNKCISVINTSPQCWPGIGRRVTCLGHFLWCARRAMLASPQFRFSTGWRHGAVDLQLLSRHRIIIALVPS